MRVTEALDAMLMGTCRDTTDGFLLVGEQLCNAILKVDSSTPIITTLIDLLTIEARSFSSQTIKTIKIVEISSGPVLLPSYHQPPQVLPQQLSHPSQPVTVISSAQQTYAIENTEINKSYYSNNNKLVIQQHAKPVTVASVIASGNLLAVATPSTQNPSTTPIIVANTHAQANPPMDNKRKHDCKMLPFRRPAVHRTSLFSYLGNDCCRCQWDVIPIAVTHTFHGTTCQTRTSLSSTFHADEEHRDHGTESVRSTCCLVVDRRRYKQYGEQ